MTINIGNKKLDLPLVQGGMGVGVSLGNLAGTVASFGAMGTISMVDIGYREDDFWDNPRQANIRAFYKEVEKAISIAKGKGIIAVNIMAAGEDYDYLEKIVLDSDVDALVVGAGLPLNMPKHNYKNKLLAPIVSSARALKIICKKWYRNYEYLPDFVVLEGRDAGGHLGFSREDMDDPKQSLEELTKDVVNFLKSIKEKYDKDIPLFVGGSVIDKDDLNKYQGLGASGLQIGTRFIATEEADINDKMKEAIIKARSEDLEIINSPVGFLGRAIKNDFVERAKKERIPPARCINCLTPCDPKTTQYCITEALIASAEGRINEGLVFCGSLVDEIKEIWSVREVLENAIGRRLNS